MPGVTFRRLIAADLPMMHRWLNEPGVAQWWEGSDVSWDAVVRDHGDVEGAPEEQWIALVDGEPTGWIQCYLAADVEDDPDDDEARRWFALGYPRTGAGIDYLVGDPSRRGQGLGTAMIAAFVRDVVWPRHPVWTHVAASPYETNRPSWRALERADFDHLASFEDRDGVRCRLMVLERPRTPS
jgi:aminoglycoside 6'-N-acetyltransferase